MFMLSKRTITIIGAAVGAVLLLLLILVATRTAERNKARGELAVERAGHAVTRAALDACLGSVQDQNKAIDALGKDGAARADAARQALAAAAGRASDEAANRLQHSAQAQPPAPACEGSAAYQSTRSQL